MLSIKKISILLFLSSCFFVGPVAAYANDMSLNTIPTVYKKVSKKYRIPPGLLYSIAMVESQTTIADGKVRPWPWTLNTSGKPHRFSSHAETVAAIKDLKEKGVRNIDVGIMQVNMIYHGHRFDSYSDHVNPYTNINVAATILVAEKKECDDWWCAVGRYHSRKQVNADRYIRKVRREMEKLQ